ncbi:hypothetical protein [Streptomyces roseoviridis]|uniref:Uncharacterized protein n=1 Tax=Streptomyces roseoviridis TaxID=67361 RepID=A0ABV5QSZ7_9ACTN
MHVLTATLTLTVADADADASRDFLRTRLGHRTTAADDESAFLIGQDATVDIVLRGPDNGRPAVARTDGEAVEPALVFTVTGPASGEARPAAVAGAALPDGEGRGERPDRSTGPRGLLVRLVTRADEDHRTDGDGAVVARVITPSADHVTVSPNATMTGLAAPAGAARNSAPGPSP